MSIKYPGVILVSAAMAVHAAVVGRYLESVFFIIAFCWAWVGVTAFRDRLQSAQSMTLTMVALLVLIVLPVALLRLDAESLVAHLSLAIIPGIVSWACMFLYIRHVSEQDLNDRSSATMANAAFDWEETMPAAMAALLPDPPPLQAASTLNSAIVSKKPANSNAEARRGAEPRLDTAPPDELSLARVSEIVASLRQTPRDSEAA
jgi:hypothetical protein